MNSRFLPMGIALAPSLPGSALRRAAQGQTVVDASWAMANRGGGRFDRHFLLGASAALLLPELRDARSRGVALAGALIALALVPLAPPGVPVLRPAPRRSSG